MHLIEQLFNLFKPSEKETQDGLMYGGFTWDLFVQFPTFPLEDYFKHNPNHLAPICFFLAQ